MISRLLTWATGGSVFPWLLVGALALGGFAGAQVATWRAEAYSAAKINTLILEKHALEMGVEKANAAIEVAKAQTEAADLAKEQAQRHADDLAQLSQSRMDKLSESVAKATTCGEVLGKYWELRR